MSPGAGGAQHAGAEGTQCVNWRVNWLSGWRERGQRVAAEVAQGAALHEALNRQRAAPLLFVPQAELPQGMPYEQFIHASRQCPTRENLHDFFNALCWMRFPLTKARLNALQAQQIAAQGTQPGLSVRGPVRDAITVFDENAALLDAPEPLWEALAARDWQRLFVELRPLWTQAHLILFGHALLEKLTQPRKPITAHVYALRGLAGADQALDIRVSESLDAGTLAAKPFLPLPVLGVPGWWPANEDPSFYGDRAVFRQ